MRTNKNCPKYGEDSEAQVNTLDQEKDLAKPISQELPSQPQQKVSSKKLITKNLVKPAPVETLEGEKSSSKTKILKVRYATADKVPDTPVTSAPLSISELPSTSDVEGGNRSTPKLIKIISKNTKPDDFQAESSKLNVIIRPPSETGKEHKKITIRQPKEVINLDQSSQEGVDVEYRKTKKMVELTGFGINRQHESNYFNEELLRKKNKEARRIWEEEENRRIREEQARRHYEEEVRILEEQDRLAELRKYEEDIRREREEEEWRKANKKKKKKKTIELNDDYLEDFPAKRNNRLLPGRERSAKRKTIVDLGRFGAEYVPPTKRRRGGEVYFSTYALILSSLHVRSFDGIQGLRRARVRLVFISRAETSSAQNDREQGQITFCYSIFGV